MSANLLVMLALSVCAQHGHGHYLVDPILGNPSDIYISDTWDKGYESCAELEGTAWKWESQKAARAKADQLDNDQKRIRDAQRLIDSDK